MRGLSSVVWTLALVACAGGGKSADPQSGGGSGVSDESGSDGSSDGAGADGSGGGGGGSDGDGGSGGDYGGADGSSGEATDGSGGDGEPGDTGLGPEPGQLTAGEWRDLDHWDFWLELLAPGVARDSAEPDSGGDREDSPGYGEFPEAWGFGAWDRVALRVLSGEAAVVDARVELRDSTGQLNAEGRTNALGEVDLFPVVFGGGACPCTAIVSQGGVSVTAEGLEPAGELRTELQLEGAGSPDQVVDVMFVVDTTGSMGDELEYLKEELADVMTRAVEATSLSMRLSLNFYKDEGDEYVVESHPFTEDLDEAQGWLASESASGGGDWPEAVEEALDDAIAGHDWSESAQARLLFLVLDAPPHHDAGRVARIQQVTAQAAAQGVRVIPVAASGIDTDTEFLLRSIDIVTNGTYLFITDDSGIGGDHLEPMVGDYELEFLNDLLVNLIVEAAG